MGEIEMPARAVATSCYSNPTAFRLAIVGACLALSLQAVSAADKQQVARGKYLVSIGSCTDCHTPGHFLGKEEPGKFLAGSDVRFGIPGLGVFVAPNLTSDNDTGLGKWTPAEIATALIKGQTPDGRILAPVMPWRNYTQMTKADALAIAAYLKSLPPIKNQAPGPFAPTQTPTTFVMTVQPGDVYARIVNPPPPPPPPFIAPAPPTAAPAPENK
jgi:mono/diheme cytochrome c family protein